MLIQNRPAVSFILSHVLGLLTTGYRLLPNVYISPLRLRRPSPDSLKSRFRRIFIFNHADFSHIPIVCRGKLDPDHFYLKT